MVDVKDVINPERHGVVPADNNSYSDDAPSVTRRDLTIGSTGDQRYSGSPANHKGTTTTAVHGGGHVGHKWGHVTPIGNRIEIDDTDGSEQIIIAHHTGAIIQVDPSGSVVIIGSSRTGNILAAPKGDTIVTAAGVVTIDGKGEINIQSKGDININAGGNLNLNAKKAITIAGRQLETIIEGSVIESIGEDYSQMIGGLSRTTIAGDARTQVTGNNIIDVDGQYVARVNSLYSIDVETGNFTVVGGANGSFDFTGNYAVTVGGDVDIDNDGNVRFNASDQIYLRATRIDLNDASPSVGTPATADQVDAVSAQTIIDSITTRRVDPTYPDNAFNQHADSAAIRKQQ